jgi:hypothetical protein
MIVRVINQAIKCRRCRKEREGGHGVKGHGVRS